MLPIRFACSGLAFRLFGLTLLLLLGGIALGPAGAGPLEPFGVDDLRAMIAKRGPLPDATGAALVDYRRKLRKAAEGLPSLGEVSRVLMSSEWSALDSGIDRARVASDEVKKIVGEGDEAFKRDVRQLMAKAQDEGERIDINDAIVNEIKRDLQSQLLDRLEKRLRFYLSEGRAVDRIAASNLISDTMSSSRRQDISVYHYRDPETGADVRVPEVMQNKKSDVKESSHDLRERLRALASSLATLTEHPDPQVRVAAINALGDLENEPAYLVGVVKPLLTSPQIDALTRRAAAAALGRSLEVLSTPEVDKSRPQPNLAAVRLILPVAALGLTDDDAGVRRASLEACARAALIFDAFAGDAWTVSERRAMIQSAAAVTEEVLPKINAAARDRVPEMRVAACRVLETMVLAMQKLRTNREEPLPLPEPGPGNRNGKEREKYKKKVSVPSSAKDRLPSQWATARPQQPISPSSQPAVTLERPIKLPAQGQAPSLARRSNSAEKSLKHQQEEVLRTAAFLAQPLDELPPPAQVAGVDATIQTLIDNLKHPDYRVRLASVDTLETFGDRSVAAIPALVAALRDSNKFVRWSSARTLGKLHPRQAEEVVPGLMRLLDDREDAGVRHAAAYALEQYGEHAKAAVTYLARVINRGDKEYIIAILHTIQGIGTDAAPALPNVAWILSDRTQPPSVRKEAAETLGRFGALAKEQLPVLRDVMINETDEEVRNAASIAVLAVDRPQK